MMHGAWGMGHANYKLKKKTKKKKKKKTRGINIMYGPKFLLHMLIINDVRHKYLYKTRKDLDCSREKISSLSNRKKEKRKKKEA
jgi:hypothetical protein